MTLAKRTIEALLLFIAAVFLSLHFVHLRADFPNNSPWMDWSKYTDEGWYGNAAIQHYLRGSWYVPGDFNPAVALPVWPLMETLLFHFTGVSILAARALAVGTFACILIAAWLLLRRYQGGIAPAIAVFLLAVSPFCYAFTRLAIIEPLLILTTLLALLAASAVSPPKSHPGRQRLWAILLLGFLLPLMILSKTTAIFLLPSVFYLLWISCGHAWRPFARATLIAGAIAATLWCSYFFLLIRPHYLADYLYLFSANGYTGITVATFWQVAHDTVRDGNWMDRVLYPLALALMLFAAAAAQRLWRNPLFTALALWMAGYLFFLAYHNNMQPRYYFVIAVPMLMLVALGFDNLLRRALHSGASTRVKAMNWTLAGAVGAAIAIAAVLDAAQTLRFVRTPEYTFARAAQQVKQVVDSDPARSHLVLSISGNNLSLLTGLLSICDDFGTMDLEDRIAAYRPGWYVAWNEVESDKMEVLSKFYTLDRVAAFPALDDPDRNLMIVYKLNPLPTPKPVHLRRRKRARLSRQRPAVTALP
ncbi:MAG: ArnT family glycosyltransferase [Acidobacteriaceae bacterium]